MFSRAQAKKWRRCPSCRGSSPWRSRLRSLTDLLPLGSVLRKQELWLQSCHASITLPSLLFAVAHALTLLLPSSSRGECKAEFCYTCGTALDTGGKVCLKGCSLLLVPFAFRRTLNPFFAHLLAFLSPLSLMTSLSRSSVDTLFLETTDLATDGEPFRLRLLRLSPLLSSCDSRSSSRTPKMCWSSTGRSSATSRRPSCRAVSASRHHVSSLAGRALALHMSFVAVLPLRFVLSLGSRL